MVIQTTALLRSYAGAHLPDSQAAVRQCPAAPERIKQGDRSSGNFDNAFPETYHGAHPSPGQGLAQCPAPGEQPSQPQPRCCRSRTPWRARTLRGAPAAAPPQTPCPHPRGTLPALPAWRTSPSSTPDKDQSPLHIVPQRPNHRKCPVRIPAAHRLHCLHGGRAHPQSQMSLKAHSTLCKDSRITVNCLSTFQRHMACTTRTQGKPLEGLAM